MSPGGKAMKPIKIRIRTKLRRNPIALTAKQRQAGPHQDRRRKGERKLHTEEMRESLNQRTHSQEDRTDE